MAGPFDLLIKGATLPDGRTGIDIACAGGKIVGAFAVEGDCDAAAVRSNEFQVEWPPRSGNFQSYPEVAEARWMTMSEAKAMMLPSQLPLLDALEEKLGA